MENAALENTGNIPRYFRDPSAYSTRPERADYRPVLTSLFALDVSLSGGANPFVFQIENFAWLLLEALLVFLVFQMIPGVNSRLAAVAAGICALHPAMADVVNYPLQRGAMLGGACLLMALALWIFWPRMLPKKLPLPFYDFPRNWTEELMRNLHPYLTKAWNRMLRLPLPFYLVPLIFGMLAEPSVAIFPCLLAAWILLFENGERLVRRVLPSAVICAPYWLARAWWVLKLTSAARIPAAAWLQTQPWVIARFLLRFLWPVNLSASVDIQPLASPFTPLALAGYAAVVAIVALAVATARRREWRVVSFGLWWFLLAALPQSILPQYSAAADSRIVIPMIGLALAVASLCGKAAARLRTLQSSHVADMAASGAAAIAICLLAVGTWDRNRAWATDDTLWLDVLAKNPADGDAMVSYGDLLMERGETENGFTMIERGASLLPSNARARMILARAYSTAGRDADAEKEFRRGLELDGRLARNRAQYAYWLEDRQRHDEAVAEAKRALAQDNADLTARHVLMNELSRNFKWKELTDYASQTLALAPQDETSSGMLHVAEVALSKISYAESRAHSGSSVDDYLYLSVTYFQNHMYEECLTAAKHALELNPKLPYAYANMAAAYTAMGKLDESIGALTTAVKMNPDLQGAKTTLQYQIEDRDARDAVKRSGAAAGPAASQAASRKL